MNSFFRLVFFSSSLLISSSNPLSIFFIYISHSFSISLSFDLRNIKLSSLTCEMWDRLLSTYTKSDLRYTTIVYDQNTINLTCLFKLREFMSIVIMKNALRAHDLLTLVAKKLNFFWGMLLAKLIVQGGTDLGVSKVNLVIDWW